VIECVPVARVVVEYAAMAELTAMVPRTVGPSLNVTVPVAAEELTVAVNVTVCPTAAGFGKAVSAVEVVARPTTSDTVVEVLVE
jgi:hypothetical protein